MGVWGVSSLKIWTLLRNPERQLDKPRAFTQNARNLRLRAFCVKAAFLDAFGWRFADTNVLVKDRVNTVGRFAKTATANKWSFRHLNGAESGFNVLAAYGAFLLGFG